MTKSFLEAFPPPRSTFSPEDALDQCIAFANYHIQTNIGWPESFIQTAHRLYVAHVETHHAIDAATRFASNQAGTIPSKYPIPLTLDEFVARLCLRAKKEHSFFVKEK